MSKYFTFTGERFDLLKAYLTHPETSRQYYQFGKFLDGATTLYIYNSGICVYANNGLISNSIFMETDVEGGISESGNTHFTPSDFTFANIPDSIIGNSITLSITESHMFSGTVTVKIGTKSYQVNALLNADHKIVKMSIK